MLKAYAALRVLEEIASELFKDMLRARRLNEEQLIIEIKKGERR